MKSLEIEWEEMANFAGSYVQTRCFTSLQFMCSRYKVADEALFQLSIHVLEEADKKYLNIIWSNHIKHELTGQVCDKDLE